MNSVSRVLWLGILTGHATAALIWWWMRPGGFAPGDIHFWVNQILPWPIIVIAISARLMMRSSARAAGALLLMFPVAWISASSAGRIIYPISFRLLWLLPLICAIGMLGLWLLSVRPAVGQQWGVLTIAGLFAAALGILAPLSQRAPLSTTRPMNIAPGSMPPLESPANLSTIHFTRSIDIFPGDALIELTAGRYKLGIYPMLDFVSRSPDRCWVIFSSPLDLDGPRRRLIGLHQGEKTIELAYQSDYDGRLSVSDKQPNQLQIDVLTTLHQDIYTHLNAYCELTVRGHRRLLASFSPCPTPIEVMSMDYPRGRPERLAYLDASGTFHVCQASSAEKGPFHDLASGPLARGEALAITLLDEDRPMFRITFDDWASQCSVAPSPTAGYGLPQNSIEFSLAGTGAASRASFYVSLANTSPGSGYHSVGHAAGTYCNRMSIESLMETGPTTIASPKD